MFNQGGYEWSFEESRDKCYLTFRLAVPKFMDTSQLDVDCQPTYVRVGVKDKVTQMLWPDEILCDSAQVQRSQTTGELCIRAKKSKADALAEKQARMQEFKEAREKKRKLDELEKEQELAVKRSDELLKLEQESSKTQTFAKPAGPEREKFVPDFDESEVPDLE